MRWGLMMLWVSSLIVYAEDWKTTDGTVYKNVTVLKVEADAVTILDDDGGGLVPLSKLPPELQKKFDYDPVKAKAAAEARAKDEQANAAALASEADRAQKLREARWVAEDQPSTGKAERPTVPTPGTQASATTTTLDQAQIMALQQDIRSLKSDIAFRKRELDKLEADNRTLKADGGTVSTGDYGQRIVDDKAQIDQDEAQLASAGIVSN